MNGYVKRMATIVAAVFTLALVLAACGGSVDEGQVISFEGKDLNGKRKCSKQRGTLWKP